MTSIVNQLTCRGGQNRSRKGQGYAFVDFDRSGLIFEVILGHRSGEVAGPFLLKAVLCFEEGFQRGVMHDAL